MTRGTSQCYAGPTEFTPEHVEDAALLRGHVKLNEVLGSDLLVCIAVDAEPLQSGDVLQVALDVGVTRLRNAADDPTG